MAEKAIPPKLEPDILAKAGEGWSTRKIAAWLGDAHGVTTSYGAVARLLKSVRADRADIAKAVVREKLGATLTSDLDILAKHIARLDRMADEAADAIESGEGVGTERKSPAELYAALVEQLRKLAHTRLHFSGADAPDDTLSELAAAERRITSRLDRLAAPRGPGEGAGGVGSDAPGPGGP